MISAVRITAAALVAAGLAACATTPAARPQRAEPDYSAWLSGGPRKVVAVAAFEDRTDYGGGKLGGAVADLIVQRLAKSGGFIVAERSRIDAVVGEQALSASGATGGIGAAALGQLLDVNLLILGSVVDFSVNTQSTNAVVTRSKTYTAGAKIIARIVDVSTGRVIDSIESTGSAVSESRRVLGVGSAGGYDDSLVGATLEDAVYNGIEKLVRALDKLVPWSARIAKVEGSEVLIGAGAAAGIEAGRRFDVVTPGEEILDPATGTALGRTEPKLKGRLTVTAVLGERLARARIDEGAGAVAAGDTILDAVSRPAPAAQ